LLREAVTIGHAIGQLAGLTHEELVALLSEEERSQIHPRTVSISPLGKPSPLDYLDRCVTAVLNLDLYALESTLVRGAVHLGRPLLIEGVIVPLIQRIGDLWSQGSLRTVQEHMASSVIRTFLGDVLRSSGIPSEASNIVVTTPVGQFHELGALIVAVTAASDGWRVMYLGANLPAEEIAGAAERTAARVVALSIVYPGDDARLVADLHRLERYLPDSVALVVGGRAAQAYLETLGATRAICLQDIPSFRRELASLRSPEPV
jgi:methanogenic corrinoid protein MtbC1